MKKGFVMVGGDRPPLKEAPDRFRDGIRKELEEKSDRYMHMYHSNPTALPGLRALAKMLDSAGLPLPDICLEDESKLKLLLNAREALLAEVAVEKALAVEETNGRVFYQSHPNHLETVYRSFDPRSGGGLTFGSKASELSAMRDRQVMVDIVDRAFDEQARVYAELAKVSVNNRLVDGMSEAGRSAKWEAREAKRTKEEDKGHTP
jgi:hypothetical protein